MKSHRMTVESNIAIGPTAKKVFCFQPCTDGITPLNKAELFSSFEAEVFHTGKMAILEGYERWPLDKVADKVARQQSSRQSSLTKSLNRILNLLSF